MNNSTTLATARSAPQRNNVTMGFGNAESFELMQRAAKLLASSTLVPVAYRSVIEKLDRYGNVTDSRQNPNALANAVVALNMAQRMGADPLAVMQNLYIVEGRPSWSSQWIIAAINSCGRFSPLRFDIKSLGKRKIDYTTFVWENKQRREVTNTVEVEDKVCIAWAVEKETGERIESPPVSIEMAVKEGWYSKNGSKWQTMDEVMLRYRTASFFGKLYAPELLMGLQTSEELHDTIDANTAPDGTIYVDTDELRRDAEKSPEPKPERKPRATKAAPEATDVNLNTAEVNTKPGDVNVDQATGEVLDPNDDYIETEKVRKALTDAKEHDVLDVAADLIGDTHPDDQDALYELYRQRQDDLDGAVHVPQETAAPVRNRRAAAADME